MKEFLRNLPKTTIATIIGAVLVYLQGKGYIDTDMASLLSTIMVALGLGVNLSSGKFNTK